MSDSKYDLLLKMLDSNIGQGLVGVHLDPRRDGVVVPAQFKNDPILKLNVAYGYRLSNLDIDENDGIYAFLSFSGRRSGCTLPWDAIFALTHVDNTGYIWKGSLPPEIPPETFKLVEAELDEDNDNEDDKPSQGGWKPRLVHGGKS